jgi:outer membrane immunogenic protein
MKKFLLGAAALAAMAAPAFAADMPPRPYTKAPAYTAPQVVYNWTGFYIGGHAGGAFAGNESLQGSDARFLGGVQGGFDYQFAPNWVLGAEAQYSWLPSSNNDGVLFPGGTLVTSNTDQIGSVTGRLGYTWGPALLYAKGGYAPNWSAKAEYQYYNFGDTTFTSGPADIAGRSFRNDEHTAKVGVNYRFGWGGPAAGKY